MASPGRPVTMASHSRTNQTGGHHGRPGRLPADERQRAHGDDEKRRLHQERDAQEPAARHEIEKQSLDGQQGEEDEAYKPPPRSTKLAACITTPEAFSCQCPEITAANMVARGAARATVKAAKSSTSAANFAAKICRALTGNPVSAI